MGIVTWGGLSGARALQGIEKNGEEQNILEHIECKRGKGKMGSGKEEHMVSLQVYF